VHKFYHQARFLLSAARLQQAPADTGFEVAFAGRSNAGKSSALNAISGQKNLARVSKIPGRTQLLNFFHLDEQRRFVDLPGYGYAKVTEEIQKGWRPMIEGYLSRRKSLAGLFLVMDIRHPLTEFDHNMLDWCSHYKLPVHVALTKADKLSRSAGLATLHKVKQELNGAYGGDPSVQLFSALKHSGLEHAWTILDLWLEMPPGTWKEGV